MTYQSIADALSQSFAWFNNSIYLFVDFITKNPLVSASVLVVVGIPMLISVFYIFRMFSSFSGSDSLNIREFSFRSKNYDNNFKKMIRRYRRISTNNRFK